MARSPWHDEYVKRPADCVFGRHPSDFALLVARLLPPGARVLEVGCGEGRDCLFFAAQGCHVTGLDVSDAGLAKARRLAEERGLRVRWLQGDMADVSVAGPFELVYSCGAIHYVPRGTRAEFFARLKRLSPPAGLQAHLVFTDRLIYREKGEQIDYFSRGELSRIFGGWRLRQAEEGLIHCAQDGRPHRHSVEQVIVESPGTTAGPR
ncbi:MAG: cyclopropane-fatty-acyl-phospholipid synthase family protein [Candidatus Methylomirabilales bacterium]